MCPIVIVNGTLVSAQVNGPIVSAHGTFSTSVLHDTLAITTHSQVTHTY